MHSYRTELVYLTPFPVQKGPARRKSLPNMPVYIRLASLEWTIKLNHKHSAHKFCTHPQPGILPSMAKDLEIGHVYRLPYNPAAGSLLHAQLTGPFERPLGNPFLITRITGFTVHGYALTFIFQPVDLRPLRHPRPSNGGKGVYVAQGMVKIIEEYSQFLALRGKPRKESSTESSAGSIGLQLRFPILRPHPFYPVPCCYAHVPRPDFTSAPKGSGFRYQNRRAPKLNAKASEFVHCLKDFVMYRQRKKGQ
ncbi:hypothetical protein K469DRAFT_718574 [Zopfia rhizophila CBS 207.26]|uniref:Uncharacterized protein n=1 Tax=Zopfia rhizophila CBS 207.26 TaxID=1314779 RepID=A0A6A6DGN8_9PEZI|nr:hypothetical protein K469DRAFT_718574 [Zopfia rhizophila CBS 207.26]